MDLEFPSPQLRTSPKENSYTIALDAIVLSASTILLSWFLFYGMDYVHAAIFLVPVLVLLTLLSRLLVWQLTFLGFRPWSIVTNKQGRIQYFAMVAILVFAAPVYSSSYGIWKTHSFIGKFDIEVHAQSREFVLLEPLPGTGQQGPFPFRSITTVFTVLDPIAEVQTKFRSRLQSEPGWLLSSTDYFWGSCDRSELGRYITVFLAKNGTLHVAIQYGVPEYCLLN